MTFRHLLCSSLTVTALLVASDALAQAPSQPYTPHVNVIPPDSSWMRYFDSRNNDPLKLTPDPIPQEYWIIDPGMVLTPDSSVDAKIQWFIPPPVDTMMILPPKRHKKRK